MRLRHKQCGMVVTLWESMLGLVSRGSVWPLPVAIDQLPTGRESISLETHSWLPAWGHGMDMEGKHKAHSPQYPPSCAHGGTSLFPVASSETFLLA